MMPTVGPIIGGMLAGMASRAPKPLDYRVGTYERYDVDTDTYRRYTAEALDVISRNEAAMMRNIYGSSVLMAGPLVEIAVDPPVSWWRRLLRWLVRRGQKRESFVAPRVGDGWDECLDAIRAAERT